VNYVITGGAGFIGSNYANRLLARGENVTIFDNLSRPGGRVNIEWLQASFGQRSFHLIEADIRDADRVETGLRDADVIVHLASQVTVTSSVLNPREDFEVNALGTFNVLEAARKSERRPIVLYASTNKVYGAMEDTPVIRLGTRWRYVDLPEGVPETQPLDFHSPYGCSKGAGDQYTRDYHRIYGLRSVGFRQGCIYGPRQFGVEDQGWVAWFVIAAIYGRAITIYGDGGQVRDLLHVSDLLDAYDRSIERIDAVAGRVYNIGGGKTNTLSIWTEFGPLLEELTGRKSPVSYADWRPGDQRVNIADTALARRELDWKPKVGVREGIAELCAWVKANPPLFN